MRAPTRSRSRRDNDNLGRAMKAARDTIARALGVDDSVFRAHVEIRERVMSRDFDRQVAETQIRAAILSRFTAPRTPPTQRPG